MYRSPGGESYFTVDGHVRNWDASPENQTNKYGLDKFILNGSFDARGGEHGLPEFEEEVKKYNLQGVKLCSSPTPGTPPSVSASTCGGSTSS